MAFDSLDRLNSLSSVIGARFAQDLFLFSFSLLFFFRGKGGDADVVVGGGSVTVDSVYILFR